MVNKVKILRLLCGEFRPKLGVCLNSLDLRSMLQLGVLCGDLNGNEIRKEGIYVNVWLTHSAVQ